MSKNRISGYFALLANMLIVRCGNERETQPTFDVPLKDALILEDNDLELTCEVKGQPIPTVTWFCNEKIITESKNIEMKIEEIGKAYLKIVEVKEDDAGIYKCIATNSQGSASTSAKVSLTDKPDIPCRPRVPLVSATEAFVTWKLPTSVQEVKITGYTLQYRKVGEKQWSLNSDTMKELYMHVMALQPNTEYRFRIACCCSYGIGLYSRSSTPVKTLAIGSLPLSLDAIKRLSRRTRSNSVDDGNTKPNDNLEIDDDLADLTLKTILPQKSYEFGVEIGRGRYSVIRRCRQYTTNQEYAAKLILLTNSNKQKKILEYELLQEIKHPNILQLHDVYQTQRYLLLITPRYFGNDLLKHMTRVDKYNELQIIRYVIQILRALEYLHSRNIAHLDLRHDNVMLESRRKDTLRLIDMGSAARFQEQEDMGNSAIEVDTLPEFMGKNVHQQHLTAPEFVQNGPVSIKTDMWALGIMIFTWLSGSSPFLGRSRVKTLYNITRMKCNLSHIFKNSSAEAKTFVRALLKREPNDRPSASECLEDAWLQDTTNNGACRGQLIFSSHKLGIYRNDYKLRVAALHTRETMTMRRYSTPLETKLTGPVGELGSLR